MNSDIWQSLLKRFCIACADKGVCDSCGSGNERQSVETGDAGCHCKNQILPAHLAGKIIGCFDGVRTEAGWIVFYKNESVIDLLRNIVGDQLRQDVVADEILLRVQSSLQQAAEIVIHCRQDRDIR